MAGSADRTAAQKLPRWDLDPIFPGFSSSQFKNAVDELSRTVEAFTTHASNDREIETEPGKWLRRAVELGDAAADLFETLESYCYCRYSVETDSEEATAALNRVLEFSVPLADMNVRFRNALSLVSLDAALSDAAADGFDLSGYRWVLEEERFLQTRQMSAEEEVLAADLNRSGGNAWTRLHDTVSSQLTAPWRDGEIQTVVELRSMAMDPDRSVRREAWERELEAWRSVEVPLSFALNGVKGFSHTLNSRRGWESTLERSTRQARISPVTLQSMIGAMRDALPIFRRYLKAKARALGLPVVSFYDLFAPLPGDDDTWTFGEARDFIVENLESFSPDVAEFTRHAFASQWIDAEPRRGKVGGAYCIDMPLVRQSRILANFDGTFDGLSTLAHELGHAYHSSLLRDLPAAQRAYPMTLAETASIFSETLVFSSRLERCPTEKRAAVLEPYLQGATQVIVDILSRFEFEARLMDRRASGEASVRELNEYMLAAQEATYGDAMHPDERHPYMWAVKGHYYEVDLAFYNFPYAFGQLFGMGLFSRYRREPDTFPALYRKLLRETGRAPAEEVTRIAGIEIEGREFWESAIGEIEALVEAFENAV